MADHIPVRHIMELAGTITLAQGGKMVVAPAEGHIYGDRSKEAVAYIALPEGESTVTLTKGEVVCLLIKLKLDCGCSIR